MRTLFRRILGPAAGLLMTAGIASPALADAGTDFLAAIAGAWQGRGTAQTKVESEPEAIICRIESALSDSGRKISNSGACAGAQGKAKIAGSLSYNPDTRLFTGRFISTGDGDGTATSSGALAGNTLRLKTVRYDSRQNVTSRGVVTITPEGSGFTIEAVETDVATGQSFSSLKVSFSR
ncbi:DUF3617 domain-containing protein [Rhodobium gokarnense]|uniref:Lipocalin-like domain-containing protein n=1 Tax=Rhodobium gokarnense TaxID=364296 RepID=A0ABT3H7U5_9HYPH|nr:DUF3617 domain-containing protein [Rhodobium gokarnense]MCW2306472.1 hypothetical protein [Rhodobium gokarnense]